jgi:hypothetical protein
VIRGKTVPAIDRHGRSRYAGTMPVAPPFPAEDEGMSVHDLRKALR